MTVINITVCNKCGKKQKGPEFFAAVPGHTVEFYGSYIRKYYDGNDIVEEKYDLCEDCSTEIRSVIDGEENEKSENGN